MLYDVLIKIDLLSNEKNVDVLRESNNVLSKNNVIIAKLGNAFDRYGKLLKLDGLYKAYRKYGAETADNLDGVFSFVVIDTEIKKAYIFQDRMAGNVCTYYYFNGESILISNCLRHIVNENLNNKWELNDKSVRDFIDSGYVKGNKTLLYDIYKTVGGKYTEINLKNGLIADKALRPVKIKKKSNISIPTYDKTLRQAILDCPHGRPAVELSYDYDSNYILHLLSNNIPEDREISAFHVTDSGDSKSSPRVTSICKEYKNTVLHTEQLDKNILFALPKIVYICEGAVFSNDMFKKYVLAKSVNDSGRKSIIMSDGAGNVFDFLYHNKIHSLIERVKNLFTYAVEKFKNKKDIPLYVDPAEELSNVTLKNSGIIMNYFDVATVHPYLMKDIISIAANVVKKNEPKVFHLKSAKANVSADVMQFAKQENKNFDLASLFGGDVSEKTIEAMAKRSPYFEIYARSYDDKQLQVQYYLKLVYLQIFERIFASKSTEKLLGTENFNYSLKAFFPKFF